MSLACTVQVSLWPVSRETRLEEPMMAMARTYHRIKSTTSHRPHDRSAGDLGGASTDVHRPPGSQLQPRAMNRPATSPPNDRGSELPAHALRDLQGASFVSRGTHGLDRSAFSEALTGKVGVSWIRAAKPDSPRLFGGPLDD